MVGSTLEESSEEGSFEMGVGEEGESSAEDGELVSSPFVVVFEGKLEGMLLGKLLPEGEVDGSVLGSLLIVGS